MKIPANTMSVFLKKTHMSGAQGINEILLSFTDNGLKAIATSPPQQVRVSSWLKTKAFKEYEAIGNVALNDISTVRKIFERFGSDDVSIAKEGNLLTVKAPGKKVEIELVDESFIPADRGEPNFAFENTFEMPSKALKDIFRDAELSKDAELTIFSGEGKVVFSNTGKYKFSTEILAKNATPGTSVKFGDTIIDATENLDSMLLFQIKKDFPARITENTDMTEISIIVAPMVTPPDE